MLEVREIDAFYGPVQVLWEVSFRVEAGELVTLVGANGAGKTTTLRVLSGLLHPRRGQVLFEGKPIHHLPAHRVTDLGLALIPEGRQLFPDMTVEENLLTGSYLPRARRSRAESLARVYQAFPRLKRTPPPAGRVPLGGRAADAGHRAGPHEPAPAPHAG